MSNKDLIKRIDAIQACQVGPSDEWSRSTKSGYRQAATDCAVNILNVPSVPVASLPTQDEAASYKMAADECELECRALRDRLRRVEASANDIEAALDRATTEIVRLRNALRKIAGSNIESFIVSATVNGREKDRDGRVCEASDVAALLLTASRALEVKS